MEEKEYTCKCFGLSLPAGKGQDNIPMLLEHLANNLKAEEYLDIDILDITFQNHEFDDEGRQWPSFTVYYSQKD